MTNRRLLTTLGATMLVAGLAGCSGASGPSADALALGEPVEVEVGGTTMAFAIDDVREGSVADLSDQGVAVDGIEGRGVYFVTYSVTLVSGEIADADPSELPVPGAQEWELDGSGTYEPLQVLGTFDCTVGQNATNGVAPDAPLVGCQAFLSRPDALPTSVGVTDLGEWTTD